MNFYVFTLALLYLPENADAKSVLEFKADQLQLDYYDGKNNMGNLLSSGVYYGFLEINGVVKNKIKMAIFNK